MNSTIFIALLIIVVIASVVFLLKWLTRLGIKKDTLKLVVAFDKLAAKHALSPVMQELHHKRIIGIDKINRKLLFIDNTRSEEQAIVLDIPALKLASIIKETNSAGRLTGAIKIVCQFKDPVSPPVQLNFFDEFYDDSSLLELAEKKALRWNQTINIYRQHNQETVVA